MAKLGLNDDPRDRYEQSAFDSNYRLAVQATHNGLGMTWWRPQDIVVDTIPNEAQSAPSYTLAAWRQNAITQYAQYAVANNQMLCFVVGGKAFLNNANTRAIGTAAEWGLDNLCYWTYRYIPQSAWLVRINWMKAAIQLWLDALVAAGATNPYNHLQVSLTNEPHNYVVPPSPYTLTTTATSIAGVSNTITVSAADAAKVTVSDFLTVRGPVKYQSVRIASKQDIGGGNWTLTGDTGTNQKWSDGISTQNTCLVNIGVGETVGQCVYPAANQDTLPDHLLDEMEYELLALRAAFPSLFIWGPTIAGGIQTKLQYWHDQGKGTAVDGISFNFYSNDPVDQQGLSYGVDPGPAKFWDVFLQGLEAVHRTTEGFTANGLATKPIGIFETGIRASSWGAGVGSVPYSEAKHARYTRHFFDGLRNLRSRISHVAIWGMARGNSTTPTSTTWDLGAGPTGNESTKPNAYARLVRALPSVNNVAPAAFANAGSTGSVPSTAPAQDPPV